MSSNLNHDIPALSTSATWRASDFKSTQRKLLRFVLEYRVILLAIGHCAVFALAYWLSFGFRFDFAIPQPMAGRFLGTLLPLLAIKLYVFFVTGHFHGWWRYVTFSDLVALLRASVLSLMALVVLNHYVLEGYIPRVVVALDAILTALILGTLRASWRLCREQFWIGGSDQRVALMIGADHSSGVLAHQLHSHPELPYRIVGFIDNQLNRHGNRLGSIRVLGAMNDLGRIAKSCKATDVLVAADRLKGKEMRSLMDHCDAADLTLKIVPTVVDQLNDRISVPVRDVEINDLLGRDPVKLDIETISNDVTDKIVMVTGAGGSIGSEICRQLLKFNPKKLVLVDNGENALFLINNELRSLSEDTELQPCVVDVLDEARMRCAFKTYQPDVVLHAAAHKHVGLMESNVGQCVRNNVFGSRIVADLAHEFGSSKFVLISTDKAVNPTSVMGASKQIAERYVHAMAQESETAFIVVRFGNVLGSNGSVVPIFKEQIRQGGPITVTDERMTRFFMTIPEATQLVLQAAAMGKGGEIFVLEMGEQVKIADLARDLVRLSGIPSNAIEIRFVGMRPGEKLYEELYFDDERTLETSHPKLRAAYHRPYEFAEVQQTLEELEPLLDQSNDCLKAKLQEIAHHYTPSVPEAVVDAVVPAK